LQTLNRICLLFSDSASTTEEAPAKSLLLNDTLETIGMAKPNDLDESSICQSDTDDEICSVLSDRPLLDESQLKFDLQIPSPMLAAPSIHFVCEAASRLLFKTVHWTRSIPAFSLLKPALQVDLVRESWSSLFILGLAQISPQLSIPSLLSLVVSHQQARLARDPTLGLNVKDVVETVVKIHQYVNTLVRLELDDTEYAYLRAVALFGVGHHGGGGGGGVARLQEAALAQLEEYLMKQGRERTRFPRLLLLLSPLSSLFPATIEELFFAGTVCT
jgi:hypothetical protein